MPAARVSAKPGPIRLARRIVALAASGGWLHGRHIREAELVQALGVSRTPIRSALRILAEAGLLEARQNQGFFLLSEGSGLALFELEHVPTAVEDLYRRMLRDRMSDDLDQQVATSALAARYGAGRSILARTLARLVEDGLLFRGEGRGWRFVDTLTDGGSIRASYEFRLAVEPAALLSDTFQASRAGLGHLRERHAAVIARLSERPRPDSRTSPSVSLRALIVGLDADFHESLAGLSGNPFAIAAIKQQVALRRLLEFGIQERGSRITAWCREHLAVIDALLRGDRAGAAAGLADHLRNAMHRAGGPEGMDSGPAGPVPGAGRA